MNPFEEARNQLDTCIDALKRASAIYNNTPGKKEEGKIRLKMARDMEEVCNLLDRTLIGAALKAGDGAKCRMLNEPLVMTIGKPNVYFDFQGHSTNIRRLDDLTTEWEVVKKGDTNDQE